MVQYPLLSETPTLGSVGKVGLVERAARAQDQFPWLRSDSSGSLSVLGFRV